MPDVFSFEPRSLRFTSKHDFVCLLGEGWRPPKGKPREIMVRRFVRVLSFMSKASYRSLIITVGVSVGCSFPFKLL